MTRGRCGSFTAVGILGFFVQLGVLTILTQLVGWRWLAATVVAVECAIVHNFFWHERWTWSDRADASFLRFNVAAAATSMVGNVLVMAALVGPLHLPVVGANAIAVVIVSALNFFLADRWVFRGVVLAVALFAVPAPAVAAPSTDAISRWNAYVAQFEARLARAEAPRYVPSERIAVDGETIDAGTATVSSWHGDVFIPNVTVDDVMRRLQHPGTPPPQADVLESSVLARHGDTLRVSIRMVRHAIVTVTYDTEHEMTFDRLSPSLATARSVATKIAEEGGGDRGFLWRLNSYWRYEQHASGVHVRLDSLSLSRDIPMLLKPIAGRIVPGIARESVLRTLEALRRYFE